MESVLQKTMQSLEAALRYNPTSTELMASLAEVYVRLGRFDERTLELCEAVLSRQVDNALLQQAQGIGLLLEQTREIEAALGRGEAPPPVDAIESAIEMLDEFFAQSAECADVWLAWTQLQLLAGRVDEAGRGLETLERLGAEQVEAQLTHTMQYTMGRTDLPAGQLRRLADFFARLGVGGKAAPVLEKLYDEGQRSVGPTLLELYHKRFSPAQADEVPPELRERLLMLLLDHGNHDLMNAWLRKAIVLGWEVTNPTKSYARNMIRDGLLAEACAVLQRLPLDAEIKQMFNEIAECYERRDEIDQAVEVLHYLNDHSLLGQEDPQAYEQMLAREAEISIGELMQKNGRVAEALPHFVTALGLAPQPDLVLLRTIDRILDETPAVGVEPLLQLAQYFRGQGDRPKALFYLNKALEGRPDDQSVLTQMESLFEEILAENPEMPQLRLELGRLYLGTGRLTQALEMLREAANVPHLSMQARQLMARVFLRKGQFTDALEKYRTLRLEQDDLEPLYQIHEEMTRRANFREALAALELIAKVDPYYRDVDTQIRLMEDRLGKSQPDLVVDPKMKELIGDLAVGRYQYLDRLGSGGMGVVHKVLDLRTQQVVAMKILRDSLAGSSKALDRFFREARTAATIRHRNIVAIHDFNISNTSGQSFIVMEYVDGPSLRELIDRQFKDTTSITLDYIAEMLYYGVQICDALEAAHAKGVIHRDIKPDNIMINSHGEVKITDFGIVHVEEATFTPTGAMLGTPRYMAPEQVTGGKVDGRTDLYSLGIVLYETLVGSPPFMTGDVAYQQVHNPPAAPRELNPLIPQACADMILKCLAKKPEERYANSAALKRELSRQLEALGGCAKYQRDTCIEMPADIGQDHELDLD